MPLTTSTTADTSAASALVPATIEWVRCGRCLGAVLCEPASSSPEGSVMTKMRIARSPCLKPAFDEVERPAGGLLKTNTGSKIAYWSGDLHHRAMTQPR